MSTESSPTSRKSEHIKNVVEGFNNRFNQRIQSTILTVLVLGPNGNTAPTSDSYKGAQLREHIYQNCDSAGVGVSVKGELKELVNVAKATMGPRFDLCTYEMYFAKDHCDAIVIVPASAGSFAELGLFALNDSVRSKTMVLFDRQYRYPRNTFLNLGTGKAYQNNQGVVKYVDYDDPDKVWSMVNDFLNNIRSKKAFP